jgi:phosphohistidine phosphatase
MRLYLIRHATAEPGGEGPDAARRLTEQGIAEARRAGESLRTAGIVRVLTSPALRALETARRMADVLTPSPPVEEVQSLACGAGVDDILGATEGREGPIALVGHQPDLGQFIAAMGVEPPGPIRPSSICALDIEERRGRLILYMAP